MRHLRTVLVILGINILVSTSVYIFLPEYRAHLIVEDGFVENLSALFFLSACVVCFIISLKNGENRKLLWVFSVIGLFGFLDEMSFGERIFGLQMPKLFDINIDAVHDVVFLTYSLLKRLFASVPFLGYSLIAFGAIVLVIVIIKYQHQLNILVTNKYQKQLCVLIGIFISLVALSVIIDLEIIHNNYLFMLEELFEMNAAVVLVFCGLSLCGSTNKQSVFRANPMNSRD